MTASMSDWQNEPKLFGRATNSTLTSGRFTLAIRPSATPFGCLVGNCTCVISISTFCAAPQRSEH
jgi:hypothetical protein